MTVPTWIASLCGVALGSGFTWLIQRNEWGRQRRWELKRDAALDALRNLADLENSIIEVDESFTVPLERCAEDARAVLVDKQREAMMRFRTCCSEYKRAQVIADLTVGGTLSKKLSNYFQFALPIVARALPKRQNFLGSAETKRELALRANEVTVSAREALGIKDAGELPVLEDQN